MTRANLRKHANTSGPRRILSVRWLLKEAEKTRPEAVFLQFCPISFSTEWT
jgi:hypothetical protein